MLDLHQLSCFYTNADMLKNKLSELFVRVNSFAPDLIGITEVKPKKIKYSMEPAEFLLDTDMDYDMFYRNIDNFIGRGMILYTKKSLKAKEVQMNTVFQENVFVSVQLNKKDSLLVGLVYRSDSGTETNNYNLLEPITEANSMGYSHLLIMGDFNYPNINWERRNCKGSFDSPDCKFIECLQDNYMFQHVTKPTRWRGWIHLTSWTFFSLMRNT